MKLDTAFSGRSAAGTTAGWPTAIPADTDLRLCRFFRLSNGYWLRAQAAYDTEVAEEILAETLKKIKPWRGLRPREVRPA